MEPLGGATAIVGHYWFALMFQLDQNAAVFDMSLMHFYLYGLVVHFLKTTQLSHMFKFFNDPAPSKSPQYPTVPPHHLVQLFLLDQGLTHPLTGFHSCGSQVKADDYLVGEKTRLESSRRRTGFPPSGLHHMILLVFRYLL